VGKTTKLQKHLSRYLRGLVELEKRKFHPHITMARVKPKDFIPRTYRPGMQLNPVEDLLAELVLFESVLRPEGAVYYELHTTVLQRGSHNQEN
jgi:2'-5' RNA ligase